MIEKEVIEIFKNQGWDCSINSDKIPITDTLSFIPDIVLKHDNELCGYIECYSNKEFINPKRLEYVHFLVDKIKPEIFILTDGKTFEVYFDGEYSGTMETPIGYPFFKSRKRLLQYYKAIMRFTNGKNSD